MILGVDPGLNGALAFLDLKNGTLEVLDMPTLNAGTRGKRVVDEYALAREIDARRDAIKRAYVEKVGAMPGNGGVSMFSFGVSYGVVKGVLAANFIPVTYPTPQEWKRALRVPADKDAARLRASQLIPAHSGLWPLKKHDGRAEAALIALYGATE